MGVDYGKIVTAGRIEIRKQDEKEERWEREQGRKSESERARERQTHKQRSERHRERDRAAERTVS